MSDEQQGLSGKTVVITGASSGFGKGAALEFARHGAAVILAARRSQLLDQLANEIQSRGGRALAVPCDVSKYGDVLQLKEAALTSFGGFDIWVNDAGVGAIGKFEDVPMEDHEQVIATNLLGTVYGSYVAIAEFKRQQAGVLINVASAFGKIPAPYYASYTASKFGVVGLSASLRQELRENDFESIHVCTVLPMATDTPFFEHASNYTGKESVPIPPTYDPRQVIEVIIELAVVPEDEVFVGAAGKVAQIANQLAPGLTQSLMGKQTHRSQIENAPPGEITAGSVLEPADGGSTVAGGWREEVRERSNLVD